MHLIRGNNVQRAQNVIDYDYQTWLTHFGGWGGGKLHEVCKGLWALFLDCAYQMLIGWASKFRSHDLLPWFMNRVWNPRVYIEYYVVSELS